MFKAKPRKVKEIVVGVEFVDFAYEDVLRERRETAKRLRELAKAFVCEGYYLCKKVTPHYGCPSCRANSEQLKLADELEGKA